MIDLIPILTSQTVILVVAGFFVGIFSVLIGGGAFFSAPLMQFLFPQVSMGTIVGNIKVGSFFRSIGSTWVTHKTIAYKDCLKLSAIATIGTFIGVLIIHDLSQKWLFPTIIFAILVSILAPKLTHKMGQKSFMIGSFVIGVYSGFFGAGNGIMLIALLRLKYPADQDIAYVKIQARFIEWILATVSVGAHFLYGNLLAMIWVPWSIGSIGGGAVGGVILNKMGTLPGQLQKGILYLAFSFAVIVAGYQFFNI